MWIALVMMMLVSSCQHSLETNLNNACIIRPVIGGEEYQYAWRKSASPALLRTTFEQIRLYCQLCPLTTQEKASCSKLPDLK